MTHIICTQSGRTSRIGPKGLLGAILDLRPLWVQHFGYIIASGLVSLGTEGSTLGEQVQVAHRQR